MLEEFPDRFLAKSNEATHRFIVYPGTERYLVTKEVTAISLREMMEEVR